MGCGGDRHLGIAEPPDRLVYIILVRSVFTFLGRRMIALGVWHIVSYYKKPSDAEMDAWIKEDMENLPGTFMSLSYRPSKAP